MTRPPHHPQVSHSDGGGPIDCHRGHSHRPHVMALVDRAAASYRLARPLRSAYGDATGREPHTTNYTSCHLRAIILTLRTLDRLRFTYVFRDTDTDAHDLRSRYFNGCLDYIFYSPGAPPHTAPQLLIDPDQRPLKSPAAAAPPPASAPLVLRGVLRVPTGESFRRARLKVRHLTEIHLPCATPQASMQHARTRHWQRAPPPLPRS
jgi:hypothetical protein